MTPQFFTLEMSRRLSSLVPEFEGHWTYRDSKTKTFVVCGENYVCPCEGGIVCSDHQTICPAWQVEDVLRNAHKLFGDKEMVVCKKIAWFFVAYQDIVYQKIEEYLWTILKQPKGEECTKAHCKCVQTDCSNHHYVDDK